MNSNEIKAKLRESLSKTDDMDKAIGVFKLYDECLDGLPTQKDFHQYPVAHFKRLFYQWNLCCEELRKEGVKAPNNLFPTVVKLMSPESPILKITGWDKLNIAQDWFTEAMECVIEGADMLAKIKEDKEAN